MLTDEEKEFIKQLLTFTQEIKDAVLTARIDIAVDSKRSITQTDSFNNGVDAAANIIQVIIDGIKVNLEIE